MHSFRTVALANFLTLTVACDDSSDPSRGPRVAKSPIVYGADDRQEFFELGSQPTKDWIKRSMVVLIARSRLDGQLGLRNDVPTWQEVTGLCPGEAFAEQPAAAFCSGILVDWDLVLTAGHCLRAFALEDFVVAFDYYYSARGKLATNAEHMFEPVEIVAEDISRNGAAPQLDYGWIRLHHDVSAPYGPAAIRLRDPIVGEPITSISAGGGLPIKADQGAHVTAVSKPWFDYFTADADTMRGSSGGAALDASLQVLGILARGGPDFRQTEAGCEATVQEPDGSAAMEEFTSARTALEQLCLRDDTASSLCRSSCGDPCAALPPEKQAHGCSTALHERTDDLLLPLGVLLILLSRRRSLVAAQRR